MKIRMSKRSWYPLVILALLAGWIYIPKQDFAAAAAHQAYQWDNVAIGGGGSVTGMISHPKVPDLFFARTDVGGAYRWDQADRRWVNMLAGIPYTEWNLYGADSIAIDPSDQTGNTVYAATGKYDDGWAVPSRGYIMKSVDRGITWTRSAQQFAIASNRDQMFGERLAVDPANGSIVYYASRSDGLQRSTDGGTNWSQISGAPANGKLTFVILDPSGGTASSPARTKTVYIGMRNAGVYRSTDGGEHFTLIDGSPALPRRAALDASGNLYVSHDNGVWKYAVGAGSDVTPQTPNIESWDSWGRAAKVTAGQRSGGTAIKLSQISSGSAVEQSLTVTPNTTYTLKGWAKAGISGQSVQIGVRDYGGAYRSVTITGTDYAEGTVTFTTDAVHTWAIIYCYKPSTSTGESYCDDFEVTQSGSAANMVKNPGFENKGAFQAIDVDPFDSRHILVSRHNWAHNLPMYRSVDGGTSWTEMNMSKNGTVAWWPNHHWRSATSSLVFDSFSQGKVWFTDWYGMWQTSDVTADPSVWTNEEKGHEELVTVSNLLSPPSGTVKLFSGVADVGGFEHDSLPDFPSAGIWSKGLPTGHTTTGLDFQESDPNFIIRVGRQDWQGEGSGGYSADGGASYTAFTSVPGKGGRVAVSANTRRMVWLPQNDVPYYSEDNGATWKASSGAPSGAVGGSNIFVWNYPLASDRVDGSKFYLYKEGTLYKSTDGGATWSAANTGLPKESWHSVQAAPGACGEVWISLNGSGLYRSTNSGDTFSKIQGVQKAYLFSFGKNAPGKTNPAVFVYGIVKQKEGIFRSDDNGVTWVQIDSPLIRAGDEPNAMAGDRQTYGRVYVGTNGTGIYYGAPALP
ncbi:carbohydrate binding domain-containing protein [Paenibacillus caui]|uniref:carbohydrate binding domain-containing protein n=1 Tax=Paenibacillus caui TaxID=2873927 RepID=UPI001CA813ED|nr:carbohydrate binding domain-containing protein [Paenibacillus caui]